MFEPCQKNAWNFIVMATYKAVVGPGSNTFIVSQLLREVV